MKQILFFLMLTCIGSLAFAQNKEAAEKLVDEGMNYHDKGDYEGAISRYDQALELDKDNLYALSEKAYTLVSLKKYTEAIVLCEKAISLYPKEKAIRTVYVSYGNACDGLKKTDRSIAIYDEGIKQFPDYYQLYYNKGISLSSVKRYEEAMACFQKAVMLNPNHASSHNAIARISYINSRKIPSLLAYWRFLDLEPQSNRAKENLASMQKIIGGNVEQTGKNTITISISSDMLGDTTADGKPKENSFQATDLILSMSAALDFDKKNKKKTDVERFIDKLEMVCSSLKETKKDNYGFFWNYYVPYFTEMKDKDLIETYAYIAFASSDAPYVSKWLKGHQNKTDKFYEWSKSFVWKTE